MITRLRRHPACLPPRVMLSHDTRDAIGMCSRWSHIPIAGRHAGAPTNGITTTLPKPPPPKRSAGRAVAAKAAVVSFGWRVPSSPAMRYQPVRNHGTACYRRLMVVRSYASAGLLLR